MIFEDVVPLLQHYFVSRRTSLSSYQLFQISYCIIKAKVSDVYLHLTLTFLPQRSLHVTSIMAPAEFYFHSSSKLEINFSSISRDLGYENILYSSMADSGVFPSYNLKHAITQPVLCLDQILKTFPLLQCTNIG